MGRTIIYFNLRLKYQPISFILNIFHFSLKNSKIRLFMRNLAAIHQLSHFDYQLPKELIAQTALAKRSDARLMVLNRSGQNIEHRHFHEIGNYFEKGDLLILNDTKVLPARLFAKRKTGARVEILVLKSGDEFISSPLMGEDKGGGENIILSPHPCLAGRQANLPPQGGKGKIFQVLIKPSGRVKESEELVLIEAEDIAIHVMDSADRETGIRHIHFLGNKKTEDILEKYGRVPLPPYIDREDSEIDRELYQTVFAKRAGAVASPTAGLHFDEPLLKKIEAKGVEILFVTLHVSYGTFQPVSLEDLTQHKMYHEYFEISDETAERINFAKSDGRRVIACGTTAVRALESSATSSVPAEVKPNEGMTNLFIYPPYEFKIVDGMITNFHLPKTTLLMLVSAFSGHEFLMRAYQEAIREKYRFYSYGDAMLIV